MVIIYYSASGTTAKAAKLLQTKTGAELVEMKISPAYPNSYDQLAAISKEQIDDDDHPNITNVPDLSDERTIFVGFPTWYQQPPMFINTFFEQNDLKDKVIIPFSTSMSTTMSAHTPFLEKMAKNSGAILQGGFLGNNEKTMTTYLKDRGFLK